MIRRHLLDALTYLHHRITNAGLEAVNATVQRMKKTARGFRNPENFKTVIYFLAQRERVLGKYNGIPKQNFPHFSKECEFRFNYGSPSQQLRTLKRWPELEGIVIWDSPILNDGIHRIGMRLLVAF
jgi:transposase